jgi:hypothetical protein
MTLGRVGSMWMSGGGSQCSVKRGSSLKSDATRAPLPFVEFDTHAQVTSSGTSVVQASLGSGERAFGADALVDIWPVKHQLDRIISTELSTPCSQ